MMMPSTGGRTAPRALHRWCGVFQAALAIVAISAGAASAQTGRNAQEANKEWRRLTQTEVNCVDQALRARNSNLYSMIQQGIGPADRAAKDLRAGCHGKTTTGSPTTTTTTTTTVTYHTSSNSQPSRTTQTTQTSQTSHTSQTSPASQTSQTSQTSQVQATKRETGREQPREYWSLDGSTLNLVADGDLRKYYYFQVQSEAEATGAKKGSLLIEGKTFGTHFLGTAYKYTSTCGRVPFRVDGMFRDNNNRLELQGQSPRVDAYCKMEGTEMTSLTLKVADATAAKDSVKPNTKETAKESSKPGDPAANKAAIRTAAAGNMQDEKNDSIAKDQLATGKAVVEAMGMKKSAVDNVAAAKPVGEKVTAVEPAAKNIVAETTTPKTTAAGGLPANGDVVQIASSDKAEAGRAAPHEAAQQGAEEVIVPIKPVAERSVTTDNKPADRPVALSDTQNKIAAAPVPAVKPAAINANMAPVKQPAMEPAKAEPERARTQVAKAEPIKTQPAKVEPAKIQTAQTEATKTAASNATAGGQTGWRETISLFTTTISTGAATVTSLSFVSGLLSGMVVAGALAIAFFVRQRRRSAATAALAAATLDNACRATQCDFDLLVRTVIAEQNRLYHATLKPDRPLQKAEPTELVPG